MEWTGANNHQWPACDNARGNTTQQWTGHASDITGVNHALLGHNDSRHFRPVTGQCGQHRLC
eukprot:1120987-Amphidinium_carterae.1